MELADTSTAPAGINRLTDYYSLFKDGVCSLLCLLKTQANQNITEKTNKVAEQRNYLYKRPRYTDWGNRTKKNQKPKTQQHNHHLVLKEWKIIDFTFHLNLTSQDQDQSRVWAEPLCFLCQQCGKREMKKGLLIGSARAVLSSTKDWGRCDVRMRCEGHRKGFHPWRWKKTSKQNKIVTGSSKRYPSSWGCLATQTYLSFFPTPIQHICGGILLLLLLNILF